MEIFGGFIFGHFRFFMRIRKKFLVRVICKYEFDMQNIYYDLNYFYKVKVKS